MKKIIDLGKIGITLAGEYNDKAVYEKLTIVLRNGKSYISKTENKGVLPETDTAQKNWQLVAEAKDAYHMLVDAGKTTLTEEEFLEQLVDATKGRYIVQGNIINEADEEDLTTEHSDLLGIDVLKFKDKTYNSLTYSGLGRKYLRKNMINGVNTLTQEMMSDCNTIYVIQYDFTLGAHQTNNITISSTNSVEISEVYANFTYYYNAINLQKGQTLVLHSASCVLLNDSHSDFRKTNTVIADNDMTVYIASRRALTYYNAYSICKSLSIPSGCILDFQGGSISNGRIEFDNTILTGTPKMINNIIPFGEINNDTIDMSWFVGNKGEVLNMIENLLNTASYEPYSHIGITYNNNKRYLIPNGVYEITKMVRLFNVHDIDLDFSGATIINKMIEPWSYVDFSATLCLYMLDSYNIKIHNFKYGVDPNTIIPNLGKSFFCSGNRPRQSGLFDERGIYNIEVYDIVGNTENLQDIPTILDYGVNFGGFMGESYNLNIHNIVWDGPLSFLLNFEYYDKSIQSDLRGTYPHNIRVTNIKANNLYKSNVKGVAIRLAGVYDGYIGNITTHNCAETVHIYNSDDGIARTMQNIIVENINSTTDIVDHNASAIEVLICYRNNSYGYDHPSFINHDANIIIRNCVIRNTRGGITCSSLGDSIIKIEHCFFENIGNECGVSFTTTSLNRTSNCVIDFCHFKNCKWAVSGASSNSIISKCVFEDNKNSGEQIRLSYKDNDHYLSIIDSCLFKLIGVLPNRPPIHFVNSDNNPNLEVDGFVISNNTFYSGKIHQVASVLIDRGFGVKFDNNYGDYITDGNYTTNNGNNTIGPKVDLTTYTQNVGTILDPWIGTNYFCGAGINSITGIKNRYGFYEVTVLKHSLYDITITSEDNITFPNNATSVIVAGTCFIKFIYLLENNKWFATFRDGGNMQLTLNQ